MGNLRSHSKGCGTCVQRRVKCDRRHPTCSRCEKGGFSCQGYKEAIFVDAREQVMKRFTLKSKASSSLSTSTASSTKAFSPQPDTAMKNTMTSTVRCVRDSQLMHLPGYVPKGPSFSPFRDELYVVYTVENLCKGPLSLMYRSVSPCNTSGLHPHRSMMNMCLLALAKVFYGLKNRESIVLRDGMRLYGRGLSMLNDVLSKYNGGVTTEIIVSVFSLCMGESIMPSSESSWMIHILGLERLFALQGPLMTGNSAVMDRALVESCRPLMILGAFFTRRPSLMAEPEWKVTTLSQGPDWPPRLFQTSNVLPDLAFLMGVLAELPALFLQCNECIRLARTKSSMPPPAQVTMIWTKVRQLQQEIHVWREKWNADHQNEVYETLPITRVDSTEIMAWTTVFYFNSVELAITFTMYHTVIILLTGVPASLVQVGLSDPPFAGFNISDYNVGDVAQSLLSDIETSARSICRSVEYYLQSLQPSQAPADFYLFFPMHVARRASIQLGRSSELAWLADAFQVMRSRYPMGIWANMDFTNRFSGFQEGLFG